MRPHITHPTDSFSTSGKLKFTAQQMLSSYCLSLNKTLPGFVTFYFALCLRLVYSNIVRTHEAILTYDLYIRNTGPRFHLDLGYTDTFSSENPTISLRFHLLFTQKHLNTQSKVDQFESTTKQKRNDLKTYPCNRGLSLVLHETCIF